MPWLGQRPEMTLCCVLAMILSFALVGSGLVRCGSGPRVFPAEEPRQGHPTDGPQAENHKVPARQASARRAGVVRELQRIGQRFDRKDLRHLAEPTGLPLRNEEDARD